MFKVEFARLVKLIDRPQDIDVEVIETIDDLVGGIVSLTGSNTSPSKPIRNPTNLPKGNGAYSL